MFPNETYTSVLNLFPGVLLPWQGKDVRKSAGFNVSCGVSVLYVAGVIWLVLWPTFWSQPKCKSSNIVPQSSSGMKGAPRLCNDRMALLFGGILSEEFALLHGLPRAFSKDCIAPQAVPNFISQTNYLALFSIFGRSK